MLASLLENIKLQAVPRWWTTRGLVFRARLLKIRGWRNWLPLLALLFLIYVLAIIYFTHPGASTSDLFKNLTELPSTPSAAAGLIKYLPLIAGLVTFLGAVWRGITAFGVKPASLLAGVSRGVSIRGLEAQASFRQKFAVEFADVTRALGNRSMLIFIDDLDRCRPENVLETLEAVNFLTTSGDCFVVIGMARAYVERCIGRAFKDIAEEMIDDVPHNDSSSDEGTKEELAKEKRLEFARQYLDKLINIEVRLPLAQKDQSLKLMLAGAPLLMPSTPTTAWQQIITWTRMGIRRHWKLMPALGVVIGLLVAGYFLAQRFIPNKPDNTSQVSASSGPAPEQLGTSTTSSSTAPVNASASEPSSRTTAPIPTPTPYQGAEIVTGGHGFFSRTVLPLVCLLGLIWFGVTVLTLPFGVVVKDSSNFVDALHIWHPVVFARYPTPRGTKRFLNHVRYLAMRQRRRSDEEVLSKYLLSRLLGKMTQRNGNPNESVPSGNTAIPDEALVALAAMDCLNRQVLLAAERGEWPKIVDPTKGQEWNLLHMAAERHHSRFGDFDVFKYRELFWEISQQVRTR